MLASCLFKGLLGSTLPMKSRPNKFAHCADTVWQPLPCRHASGLPKQDLHNIIDMVVEIFVLQGRLARPHFRRGPTQHLAGWPVCDSQEVTKKAFILSAKSIKTQLSICRVHCTHVASETFCKSCLEQQLALLLPMSASYSYGQMHAHLQI